MEMKLISLFFIYSFLFANVATAQSLVEDANLSQDMLGMENTFTETIKIISDTKKIFIITNNNEQLGPGDYISIAIDESLAARAVVAKLHQGQVGIKILKIYSVAQWGKLRRDLPVLIIKGDDSYFGKKPEVAVDDSPVAKIRSEEDLYTGDVVDDDIAVFDDAKNRNIRPDNLVSLYGTYFYAKEIASREEKDVRTMEIGVSWAFQFADNFYAEGIYGRALLNNYPLERKQTLSNHLTGRLKYNIKGPLYTFFMPYIGYHTYNISSPSAGKGDDLQINEEELQAVNKLKKSGVIAGVTVLRRLVPGWFVKADLGTDVVNVGFAIEF